LSQTIRLRIRLSVMRLNQFLKPFQIFALHKVKKYYVNFVQFYAYVKQNALHKVSLDYVKQILYLQLYIKLKNEPFIIYKEIIEGYAGGYSQNL